MPKFLIVNADDFALSPGVNQGILEAFQRGILRSTSILANGIAFQDALACAKSLPDLGLGLHVNLSSGKPVADSGSVFSLLGDAGEFSGATALATGLRSGRITSDVIRKEVEAQLTMLYDNGLRASHLDAHHHVHRFPEVFRVMVDSAVAFGIPALRTTAEPMPPWKRMLSKEPVKRMVFGRHTSMYRTWIQEAGLKTVDTFFGMDKIVASDPLAEFSRILGSLPEGVSELMCHAGHADEVLKQSSMYTDRREQELRAICDGSLMEIVSREGIQLIRYDQMP